MATSGAIPGTRRRHGRDLPLDPLNLPLGDSRPRLDVAMVATPCPAAFRYSPTVLVENDDTHSNENHIHTVWRDLEDVLG